MKDDSFFVEPEILIRLLPNSKKENRIILIDLEIDVLRGNNIRFDLTVSINPLLINKQNPKVYRIGCTGAQINLSKENGEIINYTQDIEFDVRYCREEQYTRNSTVGLTGKSSNLSFTLGRGNKNTFKTEYQGTRRILRSSPLYNSIKWDFVNPSMDPSCSLIEGSFHLFATSTDRLNINELKIEIIPYNIRVAEPEGKVLSVAQSKLIQYSLFKQNELSKRVDEITNNRLTDITITRNNH